MLAILAILIIAFKPGGVPLVNYTVYLPPNSTIALVNLPVKPIPDTVEAVNDTTGSLIPISLYSNGTLAIFAFGGGYVSIIYYGNYTFISNQLLYMVNVSSPTNITLIIPPYIIPFNLPINIIQYSIVNKSTLIIILPSGNYTLQYVYVPKIPAATSTTTTATKSTSTSPISTITTSTSTTAKLTSTSTSTASVSSQSTTTTSTSTVSASTTAQTSVTSPTSITSYTSSSAPLQYTTATVHLPTYIYAVVIVVVVVIVFVVLVVTRSRAAESVILDDVDRLIIATLKQYGGSLYQSQLQQLTNIPKTTLWRHVMRLRDLGIVRVDKVDGLNKVTLIKDI